MSIDIIHSADDDLAESQHLTPCRGFIRFGFVFAATAGPPCATCSIARIRFPDHRASRVIRTVVAPWRSPDFTWRQLMQFSLANCLLQISIVCFLDIMSVGCCAIAQHPATIDLHVQRSALSIWRLPHTRSILRALHSDFITFEQGYLGARARAGLSFPITPLSGGITVAC